MFRYTFAAGLTIILALVAVALSVGGSPKPAAAANFAVTKTADTADGTCDSDCSLREAVIAANASAGLDFISLPSGTYSLTIVGGGEDSALTGDLDITDNLEINGAGLANTTIEVGAGDDRVFDVIIVSSITATLLTAKDLQLRNGKGDVGFGCECGGGILVRTDAWLRLVNTRVANNAAIGGTLSTGGGIDNGGTLTLENTVVSGNTADFAGGINNGPAASFTMTGGSIESNTASGSVGGVELPSGSAATLIRAQVIGNTAGGSGGGLDVSGSLNMSESNVGGNSAAGGAGINVSGGTVSIDASSVHTNFASGDGAGIFSNGTITLTNSTISSNGAGGLGSGILNNVVGNLTSTNSTIAGNNAPSGLHNFGTAQLKNTIIGSNKGADCVVPAAVTSLGHNLDSDGTCMLSGPGDLPNRDPRIGPLAFTTGPTFWHPLLGDSPAIDAGDDNGCPATDQRGTTRPLDGNGDGTPVCDIGSYEIFQEIAPTPSPGPSVTPVQPIAVPETGGPAGRAGLPLWHMVVALSALAGAAAVSFRVACRRRD